MAKISIMSTVLLIDYRGSPSISPWRCLRRCSTRPSRCCLLRNDLEKLVKRIRWIGEGRGVWHTSRGNPREHLDAQSLLTGNSLPLLGIIARIRVVLQVRGELQNLKRFPHVQIHRLRIDWLHECLSEMVLLCGCSRRHPCHTPLSAPPPCLGCRHRTSGGQRWRTVPCCGGYRYESGAHFGGLFLSREKERTWKSPTPHSSPSSSSDSCSTTLQLGLLWNNDGSGTAHHSLRYGDFRRTPASNLMGQNLSKYWRGGTLLSCSCCCRRRLFWCHTTSTSRLRGSSRGYSERLGGIITTIINIFRPPPPWPIYTSCRNFSRDHNFKQISKIPRNKVSKAQW